jgi:HD-GYP domain-containing protein (c-di-GMP phosphodiesterase class II)
MLSKARSYSSPLKFAALPNMYKVSTVPVSDAMLALAFVGDLSMGQPTNHSVRTARLAALLAAQEGASEEECAAAYSVALLRWSGCTANAGGFSQLLGDDVAGRRSMLALMQPGFGVQTRQQIYPLAQIHCEVSGDIAAMLSMPRAVETGLRHIFETYDGQGMPGLLKHPHLPASVYRVALVSDLEILSRVHGIDAALAYVGSQSNIKYPDELVQLLIRFARDWLALLSSDVSPPVDVPSSASTAPNNIPLTLVADVIDLKLPWLAGYSRQVAELAHAAAALQGLAPTIQEQLYSAGLIHGIGRAAIPNSVWNTPGRLDASAWEQVRLAPYWTSRAAQQIRSLTLEVNLASHAYERQNGTGYFRSLADEAITIPQRTLAIAVAWIALCSPRPWRAPFSKVDASARLRDEAVRGGFDPVVVDAVLAAASGQRLKPPAKAAAVLTNRETEVLRKISLGESNKEVARSLAVSPSTVRTHVESIFRKLQCSTRAAATLKAYTMEII